MRYRLLWLIPLLLFLIVVIGLGLIVSTEPGTRWLLSQAGRFAPGLQIKRIDGTLLGPLSLKGIDYTEESLQLSADEVRLAWRPARLLQGELSIESLALQGIDYRQSAKETAPPESGKMTPPSIDLPLRIVVTKATADEIILTSGDQTVTIDHVALAGRMDEQGLQIESFQVTAPQFEVSLSGKVSPQGDYPFQVFITWSTEMMPDAPLQGEGEVHGTLKQFSLRHQINTPFNVSTHGIIRLENGTPIFDLNGTWREVKWPPTEASMVESTDGSYRLNGRSDSYQFHLQADLHGPNLPDTLWKIEGTGTDKAANIREVAIQTLDGTIRGQGEIAWQPELRWRLALDGEKINPGSHWAEWKGNLGFQVETRGTFSHGDPIAQVRLSKLKGQLRGYPVHADAGLKVNRKTYELETLDLRSGEARLTAAGALKETWDLRWKIQAPDLATLLPDAGGRLAGSGRIRGPKMLPTLSADVQGQGLKWTDTTVKRLSLKGLVDLQDQVDSHVALQIEGAQAAGQTVTQLNLEGKGRIAGHTILFDARTRDQRVSIRMQGGMKGKRWKGDLKESFLQDKSLGKWLLEKPVPMLLAAEAVDFQQGCWLAESTHRQEPARICIGGRWQQQQGWQTEGRAEQIPLDLVKPFLPPEATLTGALHGEWSALQRDGRLQFKTKWTAEPGVLVYKAAQEESISFPYRDGRFQAELAEETLRVETNLTLTGHGAIQTRLTAAPFGLNTDWRQSRLEGMLRADLDRLEPIAVVVPAISKPAGKLKVDFALAGTVLEPRVTGRASLEEGKMYIQPLGINIDPLRLEIRSAGQNTLQIDAEAKSGPGRLKVNGAVTLDADQGWPVHLSIQGEKFEAIHRPDIRLTASPDLTLQLKGKRVDLNGELLIPEAEITPRELPKGAVRVSEDAVIVRAPSGKEPGAEEAEGWQIYTRVLIRLGNEVSFNGFGLSAKITGQLLATEAPNQATLAEGTLQIVEGRYQAYGQKLEIAEGRLIFAGPTDNPGVDIRAVRKVEEITAGIHVNGTLKRPQSTLFSEPAMDEANTLSYLLLGRPINQASSEEGDLMTKAIAALGVRGGNLLAKRIGRTLGLDEVRIEAENSIEDATLVIGRYLSPRFYVSYGIGLFEATNTLSLRYTINRKLTLRAESGEENAIDLLYTREYN